MGANGTSNSRRQIPHFPPSTGQTLTRQRFISMERDTTQKRIEAVAEGSGDQKAPSRHGRNVSDQKLTNNRTSSITSRQSNGSTAPPIHRKN